MMEETCEGERKPTDDCQEEEVEREEERRKMRIWNLNSGRKSAATGMYICIYKYGNFGESAYK